MILPVLTGAALASGCSTMDAAETAVAPGCTSRNDVNQLDDYELGQIANACRAAAQDVRANNLQASIANYRAGRAWRAQGEMSNGYVSPEPPRAPIWQSAAGALEAALANLTPPMPGADPTRESRQVEDTWVAAKLELARVRGYMRDWDVALQHATDVYQRYTDGRQISAVYERARINLLRYSQDDPNPAYQERAFEDLAQFSSPREDVHPDAKQARLEVVRLAQTLAENALNERNLERARRLFVAGKDAAVALRRTGAQDQDAAIAVFDLGLGKVEVLRADLGGPDVVGGCERRPLYPAPLEAAIRENLDAAAPYNPEAHRWAGCALLALGQLHPAIARFRAAAGTAEGSANAATQLSLARALRDASKTDPAGGLDFRNQSLRVYAEALALISPETQKDQRAGVLVETANAILEFTSISPGVDLRPACEARLTRVTATDPLARADSTPFACSITMLNEAKALAPEQPEAFLRLGVIYKDMMASTPQGARLASIFNAAFVNLEEAVRKSGANSDIRAEANFHLSRVSEEAHVAGYRTAPAGARAPRRGRDLGTISIESADEAARLFPDRFSSQACLARIYFNRTRAEGGRYCETESTNPLALLYEGMFYLRETYHLRGAAQSSAWESAIEAFRSGVNQLDIARLGDPAAMQLRGRLMAGQGYAYTCAGFASTGEAILTQIPEDAENYFIRYGFQRCAGRRN